MPGPQSQKAGKGDNKVRTVASKSATKNTVNHTKTPSAYNRKYSCCLREEYHANVPTSGKTETNLKRNISLVA